MRNTAIALGWAFILAFTFFIALIHAGCGSSSKPVAKPEPKSAVGDYYCLMVERKDHADVVLCSSRELCEHAHKRLVYFFEPLSTRYGMTGLSDCVAVQAEFTAK